MAELQGPPQARSGDRIGPGNSGAAGVQIFTTCLMLCSDE